MINYDVIVRSDYDYMIFETKYCGMRIRDRLLYTYELERFHEKLVEKFNNELNNL